MTQNEWYKKLRSFVPSWVFEKDKYAVAMFKAIASVVGAIEEDANDQAEQTFIISSEAPTLDAHGAERSNPRLEFEVDAPYALRVQRITSATDRESIRALVNSFLLVGPCIILEAPFDKPYVARDTFCSRENYLIQASRNYFLIVVPKQVHAPYSFTSRENFASRLSFVGAANSTQEILSSAVAAVNRAKAFGVMYSVVEKLN